MDNQEAFNFIGAHLLTQRAQSRDPSGCRYRGPNGTKCAVGALIPDDQYDPTFEGSPVGAIQDDTPALEGLDFQLLSQLQNIHDLLPNPQQWGAELRTVAKAHNLSIAQLAQQFPGDF